ncbi:phosphoglucosamine mutase [Candidatus Saganbacteria bacterium CG08_land_8_20_14_0_20_45_16]|uniref:Phosphoglucosamine mutase n=1 Tax=Candidatus Saganbacteria bacterium CG08_land_8_20_14_0_20_45_16 TaxID=2014293 RepID=A0A2H0Y110_UNCSA|nr:MAG: phosphoglucosamine mutase [Candidatus Saganbacteria bacterium CG08_land_8_20_14_0_20_45_16]
MALKISISGVRGYFPESLSLNICLDFAKAFGSYLGPNGAVVIGTDSRASSQEIKKTMFEGLQSTGVKVIDLGICPTPTVGIMTRELKAFGGIIITASHNPLPWNGFKFVRSDGIFLNEAQANELIKLYEEKKFTSGQGQGIIINRSGIAKHINKVLQIVDVEKIKNKKFKVAIDACNGAGSVATVKMAEALGCQVIPINCDTSKPFPHDPEPIAKNLTELCATIKKAKADIGFALDSDADRLAIVSNEGQPIGEELTLCLATKFALTKTPGQQIIVTNLSTTQLLDDIAKEHGSQVERTKIGEVHVAERIKALNALIGGEGNGGVIFPAIGFNRDSLAGLAMILNLLAETNQTITELVAGLPKYYVIKEKINCASLAQSQQKLADAKQLFKQEKLDLTEGVKVLFSHGWVHVRASNTEPIIRVIAESLDEKAAHTLVKKVLKALA